MTENLTGEKLPDEEGKQFMSATEQGRNSFWRYLVLTVLPFIVSNSIGAIPLFIVLALYSRGKTLEMKGGIPDFTALGIDLNLGLVVMLIPFILGLLTFLFLFKPLHGRDINSVINGGRKIRWGRIFYSAFVWIVISALWLTFAIKSDPSNFRLNNISGSLITLAVLSVILIPFQAGFEEILFRGYLMQGFGKFAGNRWLPLVVTSLLFGLMHGLNPEVKEYGFFIMIPQYVFFGLVFAVVTLMDDGIEVAIGAHAANNVFLSIILTNKDSALQTAAMYEQLKVDPQSDFLALVLMSVVFVFVMWISLRWRDSGKLYAKL